MATLGETSRLHLFEQSGAHLSGRSGHRHSRLLQRTDLLLSATFAASDDRSRVTHSPTRRCRQASNKRDDGLGVGAAVVLRQIISGHLFGVSSNFTNQYDSLSLANHNSFGDPKSQTKTNLWFRCHSERFRDNR